MVLSRGGPAAGAMAGPMAGAATEMAAEKAGTASHFSPLARYGFGVIDPLKPHPATVR